MVYYAPACTPSVHPLCFSHCGLRSSNHLTVGKQTRGTRTRSQTNRQPARTRNTRTTDKEGKQTRKARTRGKCKQTDGHRQADTHGSAHWGSIAWPCASSRDPRPRDVECALGRCRVNPTKRPAILPKTRRTIGGGFSRAAGTRPARAAVEGCRRQTAS